MAETQPLIAQDPESHHGAKPSWKARTARILVHPVLHKSVIALVRSLNRHPSKIQN